MTRKGKTITLIVGTIVAFALWKALVSPRHDIAPVGATGGVERTANQVSVLDDRQINGQPRQMTTFGNGKVNNAGDVEGPLQMLLTAHANCTPSTNIVYIKVHKTGSSTLQNIFYRFGDERDLTFALPASNFYIEGVGEFKPEKIIPPPSGRHYNIMANHVRLFYHDIKKIMPENTKFVTLIREAASHFSSMYSYFVMKRVYKVDTEQFLLNPKRYYEQFNMNKLTRLSGRDPELFDLGINKQDLYKQEKVDEYIRFLDAKMGLVLITEHFFESLILLKDLMCWDLRTIVHLNSKLRVQLEGKGQKVAEPNSEKAEALTKRLNEWNVGNFKLYNHFNRSLWRKVDEYGRSRMNTEIEELKTLCKAYENECMSGTKIRDISYWSGPFGLQEYVLRKDKKNNKTCRRLGMSEPEFVPYLRKKHKALLLKH